MKKLIALFLVFMVSFVILGCKKTSETNTEAETSEVATEEAPLAAEQNEVIQVEEPRTEIEEPIQTITPEEPRVE